MALNAMWREAPEVLAAVTEDPLLQVAGAATLVSALSYSFLYKASQLLSPKLVKGYRRLKRQDKIDWNTRLPSTVHAVVVSFLCIWALCYSGDFFDGSSGSNSSSSSSSLPIVMRVSELSYTILGISAGYFLVDACVITIHPEIGTKEMAIHHAVALLSLAIGAQVACMHVYMMLVLLTELTTPCVNLRWYLDKADLKHTKLYAVNGLLMTLVWGVARVVLFVPFYAHVLYNWQYVMQIPPHAIVMLLGVPLLLWGLNTMWFVKIVKGAVKLVFPKKEQQQQQHKELAEQVQQKQQQKQQKQEGQFIPAGKAADLSSGAVEIMAYAHQHAE